MKVNQFTQCICDATAGKRNETARFPRCSSAVGRASRFIDTKAGRLGLRFFQQSDFPSISQLAATRAAVQEMEEDEVDRQLTKIEVSSASGRAGGSSFNPSRCAASCPALITINALH